MERNSPSKPESTDEISPLSSFSRATQVWFERMFGAPTSPQAQGWPPIQSGDNTLILAPTGSGKTLAAFLWAIDRLYHELTNLEPAPSAGITRESSISPVSDQTSGEQGVRILYISPLKALNNDIGRNLRVPLNGIRQVSQDMDVPFPEIRVAIRSGDTPQSERRAMLRQPPHILITTPESLYLLLTSPRARHIFRSVRTVIMDEIHTLVGTKRGVHLSLSLERLNALTGSEFQRIGLSATIHPLEEAALFLGGGVVHDSKVIPRPVTVVDAHYHKDLDLQVVSPVADFRNLPGNSVWPAVIPQLLDLIHQHHSTLIFCNGRRLAERTADRLNEHWSAEEEGRPSPLIQDGVASGLGTFATGMGFRSGPIRAHHGSVSRESRLEMEHDLKAGELPALVATSSLELGIDIGAVDLVVQLQAPRSVSQGLQRVGRSGHLVGQTSCGRFFPTHRSEVVEMAAVVGGMLHGDVEPTYTPRNPLDVLAQHIVAMVSVEPWDVDALYDAVRRAYAYHELSPEVYTSVVEMLAGRYAHHTRRELRARLAWDRVNNVLQALPGSRMLALTNGGTIPDVGTFAAYRENGRIRLGELDEEFVFETRIGDVFMLGSQSWRVTDITEDKLLVTEATGVVPRMPFWHGELPWRPYELGKAVGRFWRVVAERLREELGETQPTRRILEERAAGVIPPIVDWLQRDYALDEDSAWNVIDYVSGQLDALGTVSTDRTLVVESFEDALGAPQLVIQSPFGGRVNGPWGMALAGLLREHTGARLQVQSDDDGILLRLESGDEGVPFHGGEALARMVDSISRMGPDEGRERILQELPDSAVFGARFRQNASRSLLLPGKSPGKRTPFWLQRLRARELLQTVRQHPDFPIMIETYRDCLENVMDVPHLEELLADIQAGRIGLRTIDSRTPSPVAANLVRKFTEAHLYEWDTPEAERQLQELSVNRELLQDVLKDVRLDELLRPEAIREVSENLQRTSPTARARTAEELAVCLEQLGDLTTEEIEARCTDEPTAWLDQLETQGRIVPFTFPVPEGTELRWIDTEYYEDYSRAFGSVDTADEAKNAAQQTILSRYLEHAGPSSLDDILGRYPFQRAWLRQEMVRRTAAGELAHGRFTSPSGGDGDLARHAEEYLDRRNLEQIHRRTLTLLRREVKPVDRAVYADFLARWQHLHPATHLDGDGALVRGLQQLRAIPVVGPVWERDVWPSRMKAYHPTELEALCQSGEVVWVMSGSSDPRRGRVRFIFRGEGSAYLELPPQEDESLSTDAQALCDLLHHEGALFWTDVRAALSDDEGPWAPGRLDAALLESVLNGRVTNDSLQAMRHIVNMGVPREVRDVTSTSSLLHGRGENVTELHASTPQRGTRRWGLRRPSRARYRAAKRRVTERLGAPMSPHVPLSALGDQRSGLNAGRWSLVHRLGIMDQVLPVNDLAALQARQLLLRWGIVTRQVLELEEGAWDWNMVAAHLRLMEMRGEVRRGYFVEGLAGAQFALPEIVERLRELRDVATDDEPPIVLNACDPANLYGSDWDSGPVAEAGEPLTFSRIPSTWQVQLRGIPVLVARSSGEHISTVRGTTDEQIRCALQALLDHLGRTEHRVTVKTWNETPVLDTDGRPILESLGFYRDYPAMVWERPRVP